MKKCILIICALFLLLPGCGRAESQRETTLPADVPAYAAEAWDAGITPEYVPTSQSFLIAGDELYFVDRTDGFSRKIYRVSLQNTQSPNPAELFLQQEYGNIEAIAAGVDEAGESNLIVLGRGEAGERFLASYGADGRELWRQEWDNDVSAASRGQAVLRLTQDGEGHYYALGSERIWLFDEKGHWCGEIVCPERNYLDLCADGQGQVYVTYQNSNGKGIVLAQVNYQNRKLSEEAPIPFDGYMWTGRDATLLMYGDGCMNVYSPGGENTTEMFSMVKYHLKWNEIQTMKILPGGDVLLVSWESLNNDAPVTVTRLYESQGESQVQTPKKTITLLLPQVLLYLYSEVAEEFNLSSEEYEVVLEGIDLGGGVDIYAAFNTRLLAQESADLIFLSDYQDIERYMAKGYLEDLTPYLERSESLSQDEYLESVLRCYMVGDSLYTIPSSFGIDTLAGRASEMGETPGWTADEFLGWLESHPDVLSKEGLSQSDILSYCLMGGMDAYLDGESRQGCFEGEAFRGLLQRIRDLELDDREHWDDWNELMKGGENPLLDRLSINSFLQCGNTEYEYGEAVVYKGFPTGDGSPCYFYSGSGIAILSRSTDKEGAYAFWEYYFIHRAMTLPEDSYFTNLEALEKSIEYAADQYAVDDGAEGRAVASKSEGLEEGYDWYPRMTQQQRDKQLAMMEHVKADTLENMTIRNIVLEEAQTYFLGDKSLEETCRVIQSRVQLYLDETGQ